MTNLTGATVKVVRMIDFTREHGIREDALKKAVNGAINKANLKNASTEVREEIYAEIYLKLVEHFAAGKPLTGKLSSLAWKMAYYHSIDTYRRPDAYDKLRASGVDVAEALPEASAEIQIARPEEQLIFREETAIKRKLLTVGLSKLSNADRAALWEAMKREDAMPRRTPAETRFANAAAQREKRAKDRLARAVREASDLEM